jgi:crotonobetainyl-CoA:carnitine CoA-transferase CaiB-like acyl-CoA transferase
MTGVLAGVRVLEHGTFITGPAAAMLLADLGADVVKVEQPEGDPFRAFRGGTYSPHFQTYNRNKKSVRLDTRKPDDLARFDRLVAEADVYIQNFRPGVAQKIGAGEERLRALNPRLIYCAISGFGPDGPAAQRPSYDTVAQAASGFLKLLVNPANPRVVGPALADAITGFYAALGILGALYERDRTARAAHGGPHDESGARGRRVEVSMFEAMTHFNLDAFTHLFSEGEVMGPYSRPSVSQSYVLRCADGKWIALHMSSPPKFWQGLAQAIDQPDLFDDSRFATREARISNQEALIEVLGRHFARHDRAHWCRRLEALDVPHAPMYDTDEVPADPQARHLQLFVDAPHPAEPGQRWKTVRSPLSFDGRRALAVSAPPLLGDHDAVLRGGTSPWRPRST